LLPVSPNPVVSSTVVRFEIARAGQVQLAVYDLAGRRVRTLVDEKRDAGFHEMLWAGDDDRGVGLAPGIYALRLSSVDGNDARRLSRIR
jgi:flagellar hook assembly protein FlgD